MIGTVGVCVNLPCHWNSLSETSFSHQKYICLFFNDQRFSRVVKGWPVSKKWFQDAWNSQWISYPWTVSECFEVVLLVSMWTWYNGPCNERPPSWRITTGLRPYFHCGRFIFPCECLPCTTLKRELKWRSIDLQVSLRTSKMCKYYHLQAWLGCAISLFVQKKYFFPLAMSFSRHRHISSVFTS